tara:strand:+ start:2945 stop:3625 length:681 start_codon:yes stop_codon:yes gene_type:complete
MKKKPEFENFSKFTRRQVIAKHLVKYELFKEILNIKGSIVECGVHEGGGLFSWAHFSTILEPYNYHRKIIGFDTFQGFKQIHKKDKSNPKAKVGRFKEKYNTFKDIQRHINNFDQNRFLNNKIKIELVKGLAEKTIPKYLNNNKHLIVSLLYIDFDLYKPAEIALKKIIPLMPKGSIVAFDEVNNPHWPGETQALLKSFKLNNHKLKCLSWEPNISYIVIGSKKNN